MLNQKDLVDIVHRKVNDGRYRREDRTSKETVNKMVRAVLDGIKEACLEHGGIMLYGFGTFSVNQVKEKVGRHPATGEKIIIKSRKKVHFRAGNEFKNLIEASETETD